ncbi:MAG: hypothetical protein F6K03_14480 [Kamptonema sp. SIO4C4]|nr:hypothetical protein [Kamptonema sp. SIO4C4]
MLQRLLMMVVVATITLFIILVVTPVRASQPADPVVYNWSYARIGSSQRVCKKTVFHPTQHFLEGEREQVKISSQIVSDRYCQE